MFPPTPAPNRTRTLGDGARILVAMPTYEFTCRDCDSVVAVRATLAEKSAGLSPACAACGSHDLRQLFGTVAVRTGAVPEAARAGAAGGGCCGGGCCGG